MKWLWSFLTAIFSSWTEPLVEPETGHRTRENHEDIDLSAEIHKYRAGSARRGD